MSPTPRAASAVPSVTPAPASGTREELVRAIGTWGLAASIVNVTIGGGIFRLPASADITGRLGASTWLAYVVCGVLMGLIVLCIAEAGSRVSLTGGPYAYVEVTFGRYVGFMVGVMLWLIGATAIPGVAGLFADAAGRLVPALGVGLGRWVFLGVIFGAVALINVLGVRQGTRLNAVLTVAKLVPLVLLLGAGLFAISGAKLHEVPGTATGGTLSRAAMVLIFAFCGVESALVPSGEVRDSARTVPRAVLLAIALVTVLYIGLQVVAQGVLGASLVNDPTPLVSAAARVFGPWGGVLLSAGFLISAFGYLSGMMLAVPRALYAFARDGILPRQLAAVHPRYHTPWVAIVVQSALAWVLAVTSGFDKLAIIANLSTAFVYLGCAAAAWKLRRLPAQEGAFRVPGGPVVPILAAIAILFLLSSVTLQEWSVLLAVIVVSSLLYAVSTMAAARRAAA